MRPPQRHTREFWINRTLNQLPPARVTDAAAWIDRHIAADSGAALAEVLADARDRFQIKVPTR